jgi:hypothetical protein
VLSEGAIDKALAVEARQPFDLEQGPLYRFRLWRIDEQEHVLALTLHHWFLDLMKDGSSDYNVPAATRIRGELDVTALEKSIAFLIRRHSSLRTVFREAPSGEAFQRIEEFDRFVLPVEPVNEEKVQ